MMKADDVVRKVQSDLREIDNQIRNHAYLTSLWEGNVSLQSLKAFPGHQYHIIRSDLRSVGMMLHRSSDSSSQSFFKGVLAGEFSALEGISALAKRLEMNEEELKDYPLAPEGFSYATYMTWLSAYATPAEIVAGFYVNFAAWGHNCGEMSQSLREQYGFTETDTVFFDGFAKMPSFESTALEIIQDGLHSGVTPQRIHRAAYLFQGYEKMFWDTMAKAANL